MPYRFEVFWYKSRSFWWTKKIETEIGVVRSKALKDTGGYEATILWDQYKWGKKTSLTKLIRYNHADIEGMKFILDYIISHIYVEQGFKKFFKKPVSFNKSYH